VLARAANRARLSSAGSLGALKQGIVAMASAFRCPARRFSAYLRREH
jgi:hypothetical protein